MKFPIKKRWFDLIKKGKKPVEFRDAHITFICEETGETLQRKVVDVSMSPKHEVPLPARDVMEDDNVICFHLKDMTEDMTGLIKEEEK